MNTDDKLSPEWDALLGDGLIEPPIDFHARVIQQVQNDARETVAMSPMPGTVAGAFQIAAMLLGAVIALWQTLGFIFGLWATSLAF